MLKPPLVTCPAAVRVTQGKRTRCRVSQWWGHVRPQEQTRMIVRAGGSFSKKRKCRTIVGHRLREKKMRISETSMFILKRERVFSLYPLLLAPLLLL